MSDVYLDRLEAEVKRLRELPREPSQMSSPMRKIAPRPYWAGRRFKYRGIWTWTGTRNIRLVPVNRFGQWFGGSS